MVTELTLYVDNLCKIFHFTFFEVKIKIEIEIKIEAEN
ncbi:MAG: hypothetical protein PWR27_1369 [Petroclostridium sp.]|jgi:hypothetical protein|nr:hypothetical protein [Petroclostridium sp.]